MQAQTQTYILLQTEDKHKGIHEVDPFVFQEFEQYPGSENGRVGAECKNLIYLPKYTKPCIEKFVHSSYRDY